MVSSKIGCYAAESYYIDHMISIWLSLSHERRGPFFVASKCLAYAIHCGIPRTSLIRADGSRRSIAKKMKRHHNGPVLTASFANWRTVTNAGLPNPTIPHGQGGGGGGSGINWVENADKVDIMLVPSEWYGKAGLEPVNMVSIDGQPKLDRWYRHKPNNKKKILAISFRWKINHSADYHYIPHLPHIKAQADALNIQLLGHGHPLRSNEFRAMWEKYDIPYTPSFEEVLQKADVYAADRSSSSFEFVGLDRPVIFLSCPKYRKSKASPRFTHSHAGITNLNPKDLMGDTILALADDTSIIERRKAVRDELFLNYKGRASLNAAKVLEDFYD